MPPDNQPPQLPNQNQVPPLDWIAKPPPFVTPDSASNEEAKSFGDKTRREELKQAFHACFIWGLRTTMGAVVVVGLIRVYHLVAPEGWCWLDETRIQSVDKIFFSGTLGGVLGRYLKQIAPKGPSNRNGSDDEI